VRPTVSASLYPGNVQVGGHTRVVERVGVALGSGVQKVRVLLDRHAVLADLVRVGDGTIACRVIGISRVPHRHHVDRDGAGCSGRERDQHERGQSLEAKRIHQSFSNRRQQKTKTQQIQEGETGRSR